MLLIYNSALVCFTRCLIFNYSNQKVLVICDVTFLQLKTTKMADNPSTSSFYFSSFSFSFSFLIFFSTLPNRLACYNPEIMSDRTSKNGTNLSMMCFFCLLSIYFRLRFILEPVAIIGIHEQAGNYQVTYTRRLATMKRAGSRVRRWDLNGEQK